MGEVVSGRRLVRTIRLDDELVTQILDDLETAGEDHSQDRQTQRYRYRVKGLVIQMQQPGFATPISYQVPTRDLSALGMTFLHGGFVHPGTRCIAQLITRYGTWNNANAITHLCRYVQANVHEVVLLFDQEVDPAIYCPDAVQSNVSATRTPTRNGARNTYPQTAHFRICLLRSPGHGCCNLFGGVWQPGAQNFVAVCGNHNHILKIISVRPERKHRFKGKYRSFF